MVEHGTENAGVDSSSLSLGTIPPLSYFAQSQKASNAVIPPLNVAILRCKFADTATM